MTSKHTPEPFGCLDSIMRGQGAHLARELASKTSRHYYFDSEGDMYRFADAREHLCLPCAVGVQGETAERGRHYVCAYLDQPTQREWPSERITACVNKLAGHDDLSTVEVIPAATMAEARDTLERIQDVLTGDQCAASGLYAILAKLGEG